MLQLKKIVDPSSLQTVRAAANAPRIAGNVLAPKGGKPGVSSKDGKPVVSKDGKPVLSKDGKPIVSKDGKPASSGTASQNTARNFAAAGDPGRAASKTTSASPHTGGTQSKPQSKSKPSAPSGSPRSAARREAHTGHPTVAPTGRERGSGGGGFGGSRHNGHSDIQDWMPFSAQQARITRTPRPYPEVGLTRVTAHALNRPLRGVIYAMANHFYSEVLPSFFRHTAKETQQIDRAIHKEMLRKDIKDKSVKNEARGEGIRKRVQRDPHRVIAGDLTTAFATA